MKSDEEFWMDLFWIGMPCTEMAHNIKANASPFDPPVPKVGDFAGLKTEDLESYVGILVEISRDRIVLDGIKFPPRKDEKPTLLEFSKWKEIGSLLSESDPELRAVELAQWANFFEKNFNDAFLQAQIEYGDEDALDLLALNISRRAAHQTLSSNDHRLVSQVFMEMFMSGAAQQWLGPARNIGRKKRSPGKALEVLEQIRQVISDGHCGQRVTINGGVKTLSAFKVVAEQMNMAPSTIKKYYETALRISKRVHELAGI